MRTAVLKKEMIAMAEAVDKRLLDYLARLGVSEAALARTTIDLPPIGLTMAQTDRQGIWEPGGTRSYLVQPVHDGTMLIDLVAWRPDEPLRHWLRYGVAWALGEPELRAVGWAKPMLHVSALDWLRAAGRGSVILDWGAPELSGLIAHDTIRCATPALAAALHTIIERRIRRPNIIVTQEKSTC
ncbi:hypothetical protein ACVWZA_002043 [Sphingomonas sp. UYAg733]